jgi:uncharacterized protein (TIGR00255 family)
MAIRSMTGFGRSDGQTNGIGWHWEIRSVNGRGLDLRLRLPPGYDGLEPRIRDAVGRRLTRGSVTVALFASGGEAVSEIRLNEAALAQVLAAAERVHQLTGCERPRAEGLLALRGVLEVADAVEDEAAREARHAEMLAGLDAALGRLMDARGEEGGRLAAVLAAQLGEIETLVGQIAKAPGRSPAAVKARLQEQVAKLLDSAQSFDPARLHQEAVLLATRADIEEELKRLASHIVAARDLLAAKEPVGRKLDFLSQEFNREANTICSKANDAEIQRAGLALKAVIDQMREQVQNIE